MVLHGWVIIFNEGSGELPQSLRLGEYGECRGLAYSDQSIMPAASRRSSTVIFDC